MGAKYDTGCWNKLCVLSKIRIVDSKATFWSTFVSNDYMCSWTFHFLSSMFETKSWRQNDQSSCVIISWRAPSNEFCIAFDSQNYAFHASPDLLVVCIIDIFLSLYIYIYLCTSIYIYIYIYTHMYTAFWLVGSFWYDKAYTPPLSHHDPLQYRVAGWGISTWSNRIMSIYIYICIYIDICIYIYIYIYIYIFSYIDIALDRVAGSCQVPNSFVFGAPWHGAWNFTFHEFWRSAGPSKGGTLEVSLGSRKQYHFEGKMDPHDFCKSGASAGSGLHWKLYILRSFSKCPGRLFSTRVLRFCLKKLRAGSHVGASPGRLFWSRCRKHLLLAGTPNMTPVRTSRFNQKTTPNRNLLFSFFSKTSGFLRFRWFWCICVVLVLSPDSPYWVSPGTCPEHWVS